MNEAVQALRKSAPVREQTPIREKNLPYKGGQSFASTLESVQLQFSNHAQNRLEHRKIQLSSDGMQRLHQAVEKAAQKGGQESLVILDDLAFIINVPERKVITAVNTHNQRDSVFTHIDSVVVAERK
jgi:flagellar operon protein